MSHCCPKVSLRCGTAYVRGASIDVKAGSGGSVISVVARLTCGVRFSINWRTPVKGVRYLNGVNSVIVECPYRKRLIRIRKPLYSDNECTVVYLCWFTVAPICVCIAEVLL